MTAKVSREALPLVLALVLAPVRAGCTSAYRAPAQTIDGCGTLSMLVPGHKVR